MIDDITLTFETESNPRSVSILHQGTELFANLSTLRANPNKSNLFLSSKASLSANTIEQFFEFPIGTLPVRYLGVPLITSKLSISNCQPLIRKVETRIGSWTNRSLSYAGRVQLIKSVLSSMHIYWAGVFILPKGVLRALEKIIRKFLWYGNHDSGYAKVLWSEVCLLEREGGLGIQSLHTGNIALMMRQLWALSNKLSSHGVKISFFSAEGNVNRIKSMLNPITQIIPLTIPPVDGLPPGFDNTSELDPNQAELLKVALDLMKPQIKTLLSELNPHFVLFDFAQEWIPQMASDLGIKTVLYSVFNALSTSLLPLELKKFPTIEELKNTPSNFPKTSITSLRTYEARDFLYVFMSFHGSPSVYDRVSSGLNGCSVILLKTCNEMEAPYIQYLKSIYLKPVLLAGPVVPEPRPDKLDDKWASWLNRFEAKSVIFCSFGSETFLNDEQIQELALGLELTGLPFFVVLNFPANVDAMAEMKRALPEGFLERVKGKGVISSGWVQQQQILAHASVGCYLCHAGFSSVIEAIMNDCQLVMLPQKSDQFMNCRLVSGDLKAGVEVNRRDEDGHFGKEDIKRAIESVMFEVDKEPGKSVRDNQKKLKEFLVDKGVQDNFIKGLVKEMEAIAGISSGA
ncbi:hypothetical protein BUALT_Bualt13G0116100 [Buddleja alternifolia]|uniref:UDP-glycosyltransferase n=1 Tax=Buddleja alternifolia TaxID=168488 RepID=A0AAV6WMF1_9LAMI|nr:hypothetical protein BUALT_Bualt13G0116100 [Buddleja alternifolia]